MRGAGITLLAGIGLAVAAAAPASGALIPVDTLKDGVDANPGDATCADAQGRCTLRAAIDTANGQTGNDEITLPRGTIRLKLAKTTPPSNTEGELDVLEAVEIDGRGPAKTLIRQTATDRVLRNDAPFAGFSLPGLQLSDVTLTGGRVGGAGENGGAGLQNNAFALLQNVVIRGNRARSDEADNVPGGGVWTSGILGMADSTVRDNLAVGVGEAHPEAGGIYVQDGTFTIQDASKVSGNAVRLQNPEPGATAQAGGILVRNPGMEPGDVVSVVDSTVAGNTALGSPTASAGGISAGPFANLEVTRSTLSRNRSRLGGGLYAVGVSSANVTTSTISGNSDAGNGGAGIFFQASAGAVAVSQSTIAHNEPSVGHSAIEGGEQAATGSLELFGSIVSNPGKECGGEADSVDSSGRSVTSDRSCGFDDTLFDLRADPGITPLGGHGGPTLTHALKGSSPAIGRVPCGAGIDQRGVSRPQGADCDSGSVERRVSP